MRPSRVRWRVIRIVAGGALAAAALASILIKVDRAALWAACRQADLRWMLAGLAAVLVTLLLVTARWKLLLGSGRLRFGPLCQAVVIGQAVNIVFPLRFGEGARVAVTAAASGRSVGGLAVAAAIERALDVAAFGGLLLVLAAADSTPAAFARVVPTVLMAGAVTVGIVLAVVRSMPAVLRSLRGRVRSESRAARWLAVQEGSAGEAWTQIAHGRRLVQVILLTALVLVSSASTNLLIFYAFHLPVPAVAAFVLLAVLQVGTAVVSVPGNIGVFHYLTMVTLGVWHVPPPVALAVAIVLHLTSLGPKVLLGGLAAASLRVHSAA